MQVESGKKKSGAGYITLDKIYFKPKMIKRDKEGHYITIRESIHQEHITIINM